jgi:hypothetical protein
VYLSVYQGIAPTATPLNFDTTQYDNYSGVNLGSHVYVAQRAGFYHINLVVQVNGAGPSGATISAQIVVNGATWAEQDVVLPSSAAAFNSSVGVASLVELGVGDSVTGYAAATNITGAQAAGGAALTYLEGIQVQ